MALSANTSWEVRTTGSDLNGGGFFANSSPIVCSATAANTASPVITSTQYTFVAEDVGAWFFIRTGTNWNPGWYQIVSVSAGAATVNAAIGQYYVLSASNAYTTVGFGTIAGVATVATPTAGSGTAGVDYSMQNVAQYSGVNLTVDATTATDVLPDGVTPSLHHVGNQIYIASGTGFTAGYYQIASIQAGKWRLDRSPAAVNSTGGAWKLGGAVASLGMISSSVVANNSIWVKSGTYQITSAAAGSGGVFSSVGSLRIEGYGTLRTDQAARPVIISDGIITTFTLLTAGSTCAVINLEFDGNNRTSSRGVSLGSTTQVRKCLFKNFTNSGLVITGGFVSDCVATGCSTSVAMTGGGTFYRCVAHGNAGVNGFSGIITHIECISANNGAAGFLLSATSAHATRCIAYGNGANAGFNVTASGVQVQNCIAVNNTGYGLTDVSPYRRHSSTYECATFGNTSGAINAGEIRVGNITLTGNPFIDAPNLDFRLNDTAGAGAAVRGLGFTFPGLPATTSYADLGAVQSQSTGSSRVISIYNI